MISLGAAKLSIRPVQERVPIYFATHGAQVTKLAGEVADGVLVANTLNPSAFEFYVKQIESGMAKANRPPGAVDVGLRVEACIADDDEAAFAVMRRRVTSRVLAQYPHWDYLDAIGIRMPEALVEIARRPDRGQDRGRGGVLDAPRVVESMVLAGNAARCAEQLARGSAPDHAPDRAATRRAWPGRRGRPARLRAGRGAARPSTEGDCRDPVTSGPPKGERPPATAPSAPGALGRGARRPDRGRALERLGRSAGAGCACRSRRRSRCRSRGPPSAPRLAEPAGGLPRVEDVRLDDRSLGDPEHRVGVEVGLLDAPLVDRDLAVEGGRQRVDEPALHLGVDLVWVDGDPAVDRTDDLVDTDRAVLGDRDLGDMRGVAAVGEADGDAPPVARRRRAPVGLGRRQLEDRLVAGPTSRGARRYS